MQKRKVFLLLVAVFLLPMLVLGQRVTAVTEEQELAIKEHCDVIKDNLKDLQRRDSRARVYLGRYYETMYNKFIVPLNIRLVENNLSGTSFINNQNEFNEVRSSFVADYVDYQRSLEELVGTDCKSEPERFYNKLVIVRERRAIVSSDTKRLRSLAGKHVDLVLTLEVKL